MSNDRNNICRKINQSVVTVSHFYPHPILLFKVRAILRVESCKELHSGRLQQYLHVTSTVTNTLSFRNDGDYGVFGQKIISEVNIKSLGFCILYNDVECIAFNEALI